LKIIHLKEFLKVDKMNILKEKGGEEATNQKKKEELIKEEEINIKEVESIKEIGEDIEVMIEKEGDIKVMIEIDVNEIIL